MADQEAGDTGVREIISLLVGLVQQGKPPKSILVVYEDEDQVHVHADLEGSEDPLMGALNETLGGIMIPDGSAVDPLPRAKVAREAVMGARTKYPFQTPKGEQN